MKSLIIGSGEVGTSLQKVLNCDIRDKEPKQGKYGIIHICFPYTKDFVRQVKKYQKEYKPKYTVIHSTVPIGTSRKCKAYHSPVRGMHPHMEQAMKIFVTYLAPQNDFLKKYFENKGMHIEFCSKTEDTEAGKLLDTTYYGWNIIFEKFVYDYCRRKNLDFEAIYNRFNDTYNKGYTELFKSNVVRPILKQVGGEIGGHCVIQNCYLLKNEEIPKIILRLNAFFGREKYESKKSKGA
mgnify:FL=1